MNENPYGEEIEDQNSSRYQINNQDDDDEEGLE